MKFQTASVALLFTSFLAPALAIPVDGSLATPEAKELATRGCNCNCLNQCQGNCASGWGQNPLGQAFCVMTCTNSCGCGQNEVCCTDGVSCTGYNCCSHHNEIGKGR